MGIGIHDGVGESKSQLAVLLRASKQEELICSVASGDSDGVWAGGSIPVESDVVLLRRPQIFVSWV